MAKRQTDNRAYYLIAFWVAFIFVTSCFVIPFDKFVHFVQGLSPNTDFRQGFAQFWLVSWFFVVKGWHATEYAILVILSRLALMRVTRWSQTKSTWVAFVFAVFFAATDEWHQTFVPHRDGCLRDALIDTAGASVATVILLRWPTKS